MENIKRNERLFKENEEDIYNAIIPLIQGENIQFSTTELRHGENCVSFTWLGCEDGIDEDGEFDFDTWEIAYIDIDFDNNEIEIEMIDSFKKMRTSF